MYTGSFYISLLGINKALDSASVGVQMVRDVHGQIIVRSLISCWGDISTIGQGSCLVVRAFNTVNEVQFTIDDQRLDCLLGIAQRSNTTTLRGEKEAAKPFSCIPTHRDAKLR